MNKEIKEKWVAALRSGEYQQGQRTLCLTYDEGNVFCCLGVLCDLASKEGIGNWEPYQESPSRRAFKCKEHEDHLVLPIEVSMWAELNARNPLVDERLLSDWNDNFNKNFVEIADMIEKNL